MCSFFGMFFNNFNYIVFEENKINMYNGDMLVGSINLLDATNFASHVNGIFNSTLKIAINFQEINIKWLKKYFYHYFVALQDTACQSTDISQHDQKNVFYFAIDILHESSENRLYYNL